MSPTIRILAVLLVSFCVMGCGESELYISCPMDSQITKVCDPGETGARLSCVVEKHPQCPEDVCLSWMGAPSVCTRTCTPTGGECPAGSTCVAYEASSQKYYCVAEDMPGS